MPRIEFNVAMAIEDLADLTDERVQDLMEMDQEDFGGVEDSPIEVSGVNVVFPLSAIFADDQGVEIFRLLREYAIANPDSGFHVISRADLDSPSPSGRVTARIRD